MKEFNHSFLLTPNPESSFASLYSNGRKQHNFINSHEYLVHSPFNEVSFYIVTVNWIFINSIKPYKESTVCMPILPKSNPRL